MIRELINKAEIKAGDKSALARIIKENRPRITEYANLDRKPTDIFILKLADYLNLDKAETLYQVKLELEPQNASLWQFLVRPAGLEPTPQASESYQNPLKILMGFVFLIKIINRFLIKRQYMSHSLSEHNA